MYVAIALVLVAVGTVVFHFASPWWWTEIASNWGYIDDTIVLTFWITGVVFIAVILFMAYCVVQFRYRPENRSEYKPENTKVEWWLTGLTTLGVVGMLTPGLFVWYQYVTVPEGAARIEVVGQQWQWTFRLPGKDGKLGTSDIRNITDDNPFGVNPKDPNGRDDLLIDDSELHMPLGQPIKVLLRSIDVLHDFYVPEFRAKMDLVPGMITYFWLTPIRTGTFDILCFELCGVGHHAMRGQVVVEEKSAYNSWLKEQETFAQSMARAGKGLGDAVKLVSNESETGPSAPKVAR
jgi:cytochrome c oxidase subunit 2